MFYLYGTNSSKINQRLKLKNTTCSHCGSNNSFSTTSYSKYFHLFFIPMFPIGKNHFAECSHCKKTFAEKDFSLEMKKSFMSESKINPIKTPIIHRFGIILILGFSLLFIFLILISLLGKGSNSEMSNNPNKNLLDQDKSKVTQNPTFENDSTSFYVKKALELDLTGIDISGYKYHSSIKNDKVLVLVKVDNFKKIEAESRYVVVEIIKYCLEDKPGYENKKIYIGIDGKWNMLMISTPQKEDLEGKFANEDLLLEYYQTTKQNN